MWLFCSPSNLHQVLVNMKWKIHLYSVCDCSLWMELKLFTDPEWESSLLKATIIVSGVFLETTFHNSCSAAAAGSCSTERRAQRRGRDRLEEREDKKNNNIGDEKDGWGRKEAKIEAVEMQTLFLLRALSLTLTPAQTALCSHGWADKRH